MSDKKEYYIFLVSDTQAKLVTNLPEEANSKEWYESLRKKAIDSSPFIKNFEIVRRDLLKAWMWDVKIGKPYLVDLKDYEVSEPLDEILINKVWSKANVFAKVNAIKDGLLLRKVVTISPKQDSAHTYEEPAIGAEQRKARLCAKWLKYCIEIGWDKSQLDALQKLWMDNHDDQGKFKADGQSETYNCESCGIPLIRKENAITGSELLCHACWKMGQTDWVKESNKHLEIADVNTLREIIKKQSDSISYWRREFYKTQLKPVNPLP
jgi:hypothetical protein